MHALAIIKLLLLLAAANGTPIFAARLLGERFAAPLDGGLTWRDGRPLLGASKTVRGIVVALAAGALLAPPLGLAWWTGLAIAAFSMAVDLASSFTKRRLGLAPSSRSTLLDQIPEALIPALAAVPLMGLGGLDVALAVAAFFVGEIVLSRLLYRLNIRRQPY